MTLEQMQADTAARKSAWDALPAETKIARLSSERADLVRQIRRAVHTSLDDGCNRRINQIDKQIVALEREIGD